MASTIPTADASAATDANIKALEGLLEEFFRDVSNERKAEIERLLSEFSQQVSKLKLFGFYAKLSELIIFYLRIRKIFCFSCPFQSSSWRDSLVFLNRSGNAYVSMFSLNTIEVS